MSGDTASRAAKQSHSGVEHCSDTPDPMSGDTASRAVKQGHSVVEHCSDTPDPMSGDTASRAVKQSQSVFWISTTRLTTINLTHDKKLQLKKKNYLRLKKKLSSIIQHRRAWNNWPHVQMIRSHDRYMWEGGNLSATVSVSTHIVRCSLRSKLRQLMAYVPAKVGTCRGTV